MLKQFFAAAALCVFVLPAIAQNAVSPDTTGNTPADKAVSYYYNFIDNQSRLYNGNEHLGYSQRITGFAYFGENNWQTGTVLYDGLVFKNVPMLFDLYKDLVIVRHFNEYLKIALISPKVKSFTIADHHFIRIVQDSLTNPLLKTGFYDVLYDGNLTCLARRTKIIEETVTDHLEQEFVEKNFYYIKKNGVFKAVKSYKGLLEILKEHGKEIRRYLKKNKIKFRKNKETAIVTAVSYYDSPKN